MSSHLLRLDDLLLSAGDGDTTSSDGSYWFDVYGSDFTTGAPEPVEVTMRTLLQDGARVITTGVGNREVSFLVVIGGSDSVALAEAEKELALHLGQRAELGWTPPDGWAPESVFDVETSSMAPAESGDDEDLRELLHTERVYRLRFVCQPYVRTALPTIMPAVTVPSVALNETVIDAGNTTTRWSTRLGGVLSDQGSYLSVSNSRSPRAIFTPAAPIDLTTQPYISIVTQYGGVPYCFVNGSAVPAEFVGTENATIGSGELATRFYFRTDQTSLTKLEFAVNRTAIFTYSFNDLRVRNLPPFSGTLRQSRRSLALGGSVRTQGALRVAAPDGSTLGSVLFYSSRVGVNAPSLRAYSFPDNVNNPTGDSRAVSGFVEFLGDSTMFQVPVADLTPGQHQIVVRLAKPSGSGSTTADVTYVVQAIIGSTLVGPAITGTVSVTLAANQFKIVALDTIGLPTVDLPEGSAAFLRVTLSSASHFYDEAWLLNLDEGAMTIYEAGAHQRLWIETATTARARPAIYSGNAADKSDAFHDPLLVGSWGTHEFAPPLTSCLVVTGDCDGPAVEFEYYRRDMNFVSG